MNHDSSRTPFDAPTAGATTTQHLQINSHTDNLTTSSLSPRKGLHPRAKTLIAALVGAVAALAISTLATNLAQQMSAPDRAQIVPVGNATLVRDTKTSAGSETANALDSSTRSPNNNADNRVVMSAARTEIALDNVPLEDRPRLQARSDEEKALAERELLEDKKRAIERQLEDAQIAERRRSEDKSLDDQRRADQKRREESRAQEDKQIAEQRQAEQRQAQAQITPSLTSTETP